MKLERKINSKFKQVYLSGLYFELELNFYFNLYFLLYISEQYLKYNVGLISSRYYKVLGDRDYDNFVTTTITSCGWVFSIASVCGFFYFSFIKLNIQRNMTKLFLIIGSFYIKIFPFTMMIS